MRLQPFVPLKRLVAFGMRAEKYFTAAVFVEAAWVPFAPMTFESVRSGVCFVAVEAEERGLVGGVGVFRERRVGGYVWDIHVLKSRSYCFGADIRSDKRSIQGPAVVDFWRRKINILVQPVIYSCCEYVFEQNAEKSTNLEQKREGFGLQEHRVLCRALLASRTSNIHPIGLVAMVE